MLLKVWFEGWQYQQHLGFCWSKFWVPSESYWFRNSGGAQESDLWHAPQGILMLTKVWEPLSSVSLVTESCPTLFDPMDWSMPGLPVHHQLPEFTQTHIHWVGDVIQPSHPLSSPCPPAFNLAQHQGLFLWSVLCMRWPKCWSFSFSISPSNEYSGLISFRMDWLDLLAVQGTFQSLLQHHSSKASILRCSAFFIV